MSTDLCDHCGKALGRAGHWQVVTSEGIRNYHERRGCTAAAERDAQAAGVSLWHTRRNSVSQMFRTEG